MRRAALRSAAALAVLLLIPLGLGALIDAGQLRGLLLRVIAARLGRPVQVDGPIETRLLTLTPRLVAQRVTIGNPPWVPPGTTAQIGRLLLVLDHWPLFGRELEIRRLELEQAELHFMRDAAGRANWQSAPPKVPEAIGGPPLIHGFIVSNSKLTLDDARRHLKFEGNVSAREEPAVTGGAPWHLEGAGVLNGRAATVALNGDPLSAVRHDRPYRFAFAARSSGSRLDGRGQIARPFNFGVLEVSLEASGEDLGEQYRLSGVSLPHTGPYKLSLRIERQGSLFRYRDLSLHSGTSDLAGTVSIETATGRPRTEATLHSQHLRSLDVGAAAAGRSDPHPAGSSLLLPDAPLPLQALPGLGEAQIDLDARNVELGRLSLQSVVAHIALDHGVLAVKPLSAALYDGRAAGSIRVDANIDPAPARFELRLSNISAAALGHKSAGPSAFDAPIEARIELTGKGHSIHQYAADSTGEVTAVVPHGELRAAFADIIGADFARGLGLLLAKDQKETGVRCGVASFAVQQGVMHVQTLLLDTDPAVIHGTGDILLESETIALTLNGEPKGRHLMRLHAPVLIGGTLAHPSIGVRGGGPAQAAAALAAGIVRAPLELLGFVDPDLAHNADCAALLQSAQQQGVPQQAPAPASTP